MQLPPLSPSSERDQNDSKPEYEQAFIYLFYFFLLIIMTEYLVFLRLHVYQKEYHEMIRMHTKVPALLLLSEIKCLFPPVFQMLK